MRADKKPRNRRRPLNEFDPGTTTTEQIAEWLKLGDVEAAKQEAQRLAIFLNQMALNKDAQQAVMKLGIGWIGKDIAKFIADKLLADPCNSNGKQHKSGAELFAKVLVPTKNVHSQFYARYFASIVYQLGSDSDENLLLATEIINKRIVANNKITAELKNGCRDNFKDFHPNMPTRKITKRTVQTAYRRYLSEIKEAEVN